MVKSHRDLLAVQELMATRSLRGQSPALAKIALDPSECEIRRAGAFYLLIESRADSRTFADLLVPEMHDILASSRLGIRRSHEMQNLYEFDDDVLGVDRWELSQDEDHPVRILTWSYTSNPESWAVMMIVRFQQPLSESDDALEDQDLARYLRMHASECEILAIHVPSNMGGTTFTRGLRFDHQPDGGLQKVPWVR